MNYLPILQRNIYSHRIRITILFLTSLFFLVTDDLFSQSGTCNGAEVFCGSASYNFPTSVSTQAEPGACYNLPPCGAPWPATCPCLSSAPNPAWYFMQAGASGNITITMTGMSNGDPPEPLDIDFICWGPFSSPTGACVAGLTCDKVVSCSYSGDNDETCIIPNAILGEFYMLLITNYSNQPGNITFQQSNSGTPGAGSTNCNIVVNCALLALSPQPTVCDPMTGLYTLNGVAEFTNPPSVGELIIKDVTTIPPTQISLLPPFNTPLNFSIPDLPCDGTTHTLYAYFTGAGNPCEFSTTYAAPPIPCPNGVISGGDTICNDGTSQATVEINVTGAAGPFDVVYAINGVNQPPISNYTGAMPIVINTSTPGNYTLVSTSNVNCAGNVSGSANVMLVDFPAPPAPPSGQFFTCGPGTAVISVEQPAGMRINWYSSATGGTPLFTGNPFTTPVITNTTVFYAETETIAGGCKSLTRTPVSAEVKPVPEVTNSTSGPVICSETAWSVDLNSTPSGASFTWTASATPPGAVSGFSVNGSGNTISETLVNLTNQTATVIYQVVPTLASCTGLSKPISITVKPTPQFLGSLNDTVCSGIPYARTLVSNVTGGSFTWSAESIPAGAISGFTALQNAPVNLISDMLVNSLSQTASVIYHVTPLANGCQGITKQITVVVKPKPVLTNLAMPPFCSGTTMNIPLQSNVANAGFTWTAAASPAGSITGFTANQSLPAQSIQDQLVNVSTLHGTVNYSVTPHAAGCSGDPALLPVTIHALPAVLFTSPPVNPQEICSGSSTSAVSLTSDVQLPGVSFSWTAQAFDPIVATTDIFGFTSPNNGGQIPAENITSLLVVQGIIKYSVTATYTATGLSCPGLPSEYIVKVNPSPSVEFFTPSPQTICSGNNSTQVDLFSNVTSVTYQWQIIENTGVSGATASGTSSFIPAQTLTNSTGTAAHVTYRVTPVYQGGGGGTCPGGFSLYVFNVNPLPVPTVSGRNTVCELQQNEPYHTPSVAGRTYQWNITGATGFSDPTNDTVFVTWGNSSQSPGNVSVTETISESGCQKTSMVMNVTLQPRPVPALTGPTTNVCHGFSGQTYQTEANMNNYTWVITGGTITSGGGSGTPFAVVTWNQPGNQSISVNYQNNLQCPGFPAATLQVTVHPLPETTITSGPGPDCQGALHTYQVPTNPDCNFQWTISPPAAGNISQGQGTSNIGIDWLSAGNVTLGVTGTWNTTGCQSSSQFPVVVNPKPLPSFVRCFDPVTIPNAKKIILKRASPYIKGQGTFSGTRVSFNQETGNFEFDPTGASPGPYSIGYSYTNNYGCTANTASVTLNVVSNPFSCGGDLTDVRDGKTYKTATLGGKCWMAENLSYGQVLQGGQSQGQTDNCTPEKFCNPADAGCNMYGGYYQWNEVMDYQELTGSKGLCPPGWHIPTANEWQQMIDNLIASILPPQANASVAPELKDLNLSIGFRALPGGLNYMDNIWRFNAGALTGSMYWTSNSVDELRAEARGLNYFNPSISSYASSKANAFSVRCVRD